VRSKSGLKRRPSGPLHPLTKAFYDGLERKRKSFNIEENYAMYRFGPTPRVNKIKNKQWRIYIDRFHKHFERTWDRLADNESKEILLECLLFQALGWTKLKRFRNTNEYQELANELPGSSKRFPIIKPKIRPIRHKYIHHFDLPELDLQLATTDGFLLNIIQNKQYNMNHKDKTITVESGDIVFDCGTGWGDTALLFARAAGPEGHVYTFDFVPSNFALLEKNINLNPDIKDRITLVKAALDQNSGHEFLFDDKASSSRMNTDTGKHNAKTITIDDLVEKKQLTSVDFIKMDIEGAEKAALKGAQNTLKKFRPKLAICVYHKQDDLFSIPDLIAEIEPSYRFWLDHHTIHNEETVLYADTS
jgi:FkbM family methyltransferase